MNPFRRKKEEIDNSDIAENDDGNIEDNVTKPIFSDEDLDRKLRRYVNNYWKNHPNMNRKKIMFTIDKETGKIEKHNCSGNAISGSIPEETKPFKKGKHFWS